jgi:hypothetical protein
MFPVEKISLNPKFEVLKRNRQRRVSLRSARRYSPSSPSGWGFCTPKACQVHLS